MPAYPQPADKWLAQQLRTLKGAANTVATGGTEYLIEFPKRTGAPQKEHERGVCMGIAGNIEFDHNGTSTGLKGWGRASKATGSWVKL